MNSLLFFCFSLLIFLKFSRKTLLDARRYLSVYLLKLCSFVYLLTFVKDSVFTFSELFLKDKFVSQKQLTSNDDVYETIVNSVYFIVLTNLLIKFKNFFSNFVTQILIFCLFYCLMTKQIPIKLLKHRKQGFPQLN